MKCISIKPDFAWDIAVGEKTKEYRSWNTNYRGDILICATNSNYRGFINGYAIAIANLCKTRPLNYNFEWELDNVRIIYPIKIKGQQRIFNRDVKPIVIPDSITDEEIENLFIPLVFK